jgi:hypothetical protein
LKRASSFFLPCRSGYLVSRSIKEHKSFLDAIEFVSDAEGRTPRPSSCAVGNCLRILSHIANRSVIEQVEFLRTRSLSMSV